jgi:ABC-2 type transport system permease protein
MPIHDQGYRHYPGTRAPHGHSWAVIAKAGVRTLLGRRGFIGLLLFSWLPFFVRAVQIYAAANLPQASFLSPDARMFRQFLEQQEIFLFFITVYAGAGLIANDRRANALQIYLSKPLTRSEYIFGKLTVLMTFLLLASWVPAMALLIVQVLFSGSFSFFLGNLFLFPAITVFAFIEVLSIALVMLALSSLSNSSRYVGILYAMLIFFSQAIYGVVYAVTRDTSFSWISISFDLNQIGDAIFRQPSRYTTPVSAAALAVAVVIVLSVVVLSRQVKGVEVVA